MARHDRGTAEEAGLPRGRGACVAPSPLGGQSRSWAARLFWSVKMITIICGIFNRNKNYSRYLCAPRNANKKSPKSNIGKVVQ